MTAVARGIRVRGTVQGVGFRPAVYRLAHSLGLRGLVRNDSAGVWIEIEGEAAALERFVAALSRDVPPLGRIDGIETVTLAPTGAAGFVVVGSTVDARAQASVPADAATCDACLAELFDATDRRYRYPFTNCTGCGPRYTLVRDVPYDRARTTMSVFALCDACRAEYEDPSDRRFHAEPNACPACGPRLAFGALTGEDALAATVSALWAGRIVAVKGLGGYHLACVADDEVAIAELRVRKRRPHKPFALMARSLEEIERWAIVSEVARETLLSPARPIVLLPVRHPIGPGIAPGLGEVGVMLPYTPLHHLLLTDGPAVLVMTSGNRAEEPIARTDEEARTRLAGIADAFLVHDREIHTRADDSVARIVAGGAQPVRRSRGFVPDRIALGCAAPPILAVGAELKNTVCMTRDDQAILSPHVGDLESGETYAFFCEVIDKLGRLLDVVPSIVAHDLHPDYRSTRWALEQPAPREPVQHHHAHVAACLVENGHFERAIGVAFDGTGCGPAGDLWGGEILLCDLVRAERVGHLRPIALPGGAAAIREPWRLAAAALLDAGLGLDRLDRIPRAKRDAIAALCARAVTPRATGAGRWFDAVAALCGVRDEVTYEGQAAIELEALAVPGDAPPYPMGEDGDLRPTIAAIAEDGDEAPVVSARFHATLAEYVLDSARKVRATTGIGAVALSGGCFQNKLLTERTQKLLAADGFEVLLHRRVPPNDGGVALGQAAVAAHRWLRRQTGSSHVPRHSR